MTVRLSGKPGRIDPGVVANKLKGAARPVSDREAASRDLARNEQRGVAGLRLGLLRIVGVPLFVCQLISAPDMELARRLIRAFKRNGGRTGHLHPRRDFAIGGGARQ